MTDRELEALTRIEVILERIDHKLSRCLAAQGFRASVGTRPPDAPPHSW